MQRPSIQSDLHETVQSSQAHIHADSDELILSVTMKIQTTCNQAHSANSAQSQTKQKPQQRQKSQTYMPALRAFN